VKRGIHRHGTALSTVFFLSLPVRQRSGLEKSRLETSLLATHYGILFLGSDGCAALLLCITSTLLSFNVHMLQQWLGLGSWAGEKLYIFGLQEHMHVPLFAIAN